jgi:carbon monoxide dehydrogenase subunit G
VQLEHSFTVPVEVDEAWRVLLDIERIAPCMPGAALDTVDGDDFTGSVKVRLGPIGLTYKGKASFVEKDDVAHRAVIDAQGKDARGNGTASAKVTATLTPDGSGTAVAVVTDLNITGKPAQFGRGVMVDVGNKLIGQFADCLAGKLGAAAPEVDTVEPALAATSHQPEPEAQSPPQWRPKPVEEVAPIDLLGSAGPAVAKRLAPIGIALLLVLLILRHRHRRR